MVEPCIFQSTAGYSRYQLGVRETAFSRSGLGQALGHDEDVFVSLQRDIFLIGMEGDGHGCGEGPWCGGPDNRRDRFSALDPSVGQLRVNGARVRLQAVLDPDRRADMGFVLDFGFGQRGFVVDAPVGRTQALVDESILEELVEDIHHH